MAKNDFQYGGWNYYILQCGTIMTLIRHLGSLRQNAKTPFSQKLSNLELWCLLTTYRQSYMGFSKNPLLDP